METLVQSLPGYRLDEYMLVLTPHEELRKKITEVKKEFATKFQCQQALWSKPHLMLARFTQYAMMEERILNRIKTIAMGFYPVKIELGGFGSYPSHTIFINVVSREPIKNLIREIKDAHRLLKLDNEHKPFYTEDPHILVAGKITPWQYESGWLEYSQKHFSGRFIADSLLLLKRRPDEKAWQIVQRMEFENLPVAVKQTELFG